MDCARTAKRLFGKASVIYRRSLKEMPANAEEIEAALADGVELLFLHNVKEPIVENGKVVGLNIVTMELGEPDASGRASCHEVPGSESILPCDGLIFAIGEKPVLSAFGPIEAGEGRKTNLPNVWLLGDGRYGAKNIAAAIRDGREAAIEIIEQVR